MKTCLLLPFALAAASPALGEVVQSSDTGFTIRHTLTVAAAPDKVWTTLTAPSSWWSPDHSYSGDAANITLDARAGGCW
ncbi:MAG: hypothetical protein EOP59_13760, partial [Sphingomonadales bacterium]